jgi:hypothetical protein
MLPSLRIGGKVSWNSACANRSFAVDRKARYELIFTLMPECERYSMSKGAPTRYLILIRSPLEENSAAGSWKFFWGQAGKASEHAKREWVIESTQFQFTP